MRQFASLPFQSAVPRSALKSSSTTANEDHMAARADVAWAIKVARPVDLDQASPARHRRSGDEEGQGHERAALQGVSPDLCDARSLTPSDVGFCSDRAHLEHYRGSTATPDNIDNIDNILYLSMPYLPPPDNNADNDHNAGLGMEMTISPSDLPLLSMLSLLPGSEEHGR